MGAYTIFDRIRDFIGHIGWKMMLWSCRCTRDQFRYAIYRDVKEEKGGAE